MQPRTHLATATLLAAGVLISGLTTPAVAQENKSRAPFTSAQLVERTIRRRAVEAATWGMPIVSVDAMRRAFFEAGATYGDSLYLPVQLGSPDPPGVGVSALAGCEAGLAEARTPTKGGDSVHMRNRVQRKNTSMRSTVCHKPTAVGLTREGTFLLPSRPE